MAISLLDTWSFVNDDDPHNQSFTVSAGTDRCLVLAYSGVGHDISFFGWSDPTVDYGNQPPTASFKVGDADNDAPIYIALWNDAALAAAENSQFGWIGTVIVNEFFGAATFENVQQTGLGSIVNNFTDHTGDVNDFTITTTSDDGDWIIMVGGTNTASFVIADSDTLTVQQNADAASTNASYVLMDGNGGDDSTFIDHTNFRQSNFLAIVLPQVSVANTSIIVPTGPVR